MAVAEMTCVLKFNLECEECKTAANYIIGQIQGVYNFRLDARKGLAYVQGRVDPRTIVAALRFRGLSAQILEVVLVGELQQAPPPAFFGPPAPQLALPEPPQFAQLPPPPEAYQQPQATYYNPRESESFGCCIM